MVECSSISCFWNPKCSSSNSISITILLVSWCKSAEKLLPRNEIRDRQ